MAVSPWQGRPPSMNRTANVSAFLLCVLAPVLFAQQKEPPAEAKAEDPLVKELVAKLQAAEAAAKTVYQELHTEGVYPGGKTFQTRGSLRVLRGAHPRLLARVEFNFADDFSGRMETLKTADGVWILERSPTSGDVYFEIDQETMRDLEWAASVLGKADEVPGVDRRAAAPLGSAMLQELSRQYALAPLSKKDRDGQPGQWIGGELRPAAVRPPADEMPLPGRVELFVRDGDRALLDTIYFDAQNKVVQRIKMVKLEVDRPMTADEFKIDAGDLKPRPVREYQPAWTQVEKILNDAEAVPGAGKRPSQKGKDDKGK